MINSKIVFEIPPKTGNQRNSEGSFITLKDGSIMFAYSRFKGNSFSDAAPSDIYRAYSYDAGESFTGEEKVLTCEEESAANIMSVTLRRMANGDVGLFYGKKTPDYNCRFYLKRSSDEGKTWSKAVCCINESGYFVVNNDRVITLSSGEMLMPSAQHIISGHEKGDNEGKVEDGSIVSPGILRFFISYDDGKSWRTTGNYNVLPVMKNSFTGLQEPGVIELKNGVLWSWCRTDLGRQYEMFSYDSGKNWTVPAPSQFTSPESPMSLKRMPSGELLAVWNPIPIYNGRSQHPEGAWTGARTPLVIAVSRDDGKSFTQPVVIEDQPFRGYCYTAIHFTEDSVLLSYCAGGKAYGNVLNLTRIRKIAIKDILNIN